MNRYYKLFAQITFLTVVLIVTRIVCTCAIWHPEDDRAADTGMFVVAKDVLIDPDSISVDYEDENIRRTSLCIFNANSKNMIRMHFLEDKEMADAYYSHDGAHYEEVGFENSEDMTNRAYHWMLSWLGSWEYEDKGRQDTFYNQVGEQVFRIYPCSTEVRMRCPSSRLFRQRYDIEISILNLAI